MEDKETLRLVVLGDSLSFTDERGPQLPTEPTLFPNVLAQLLEEALLRPVDVTVLARAGSDVREAWRMVFKDRHAQFDVLMSADALVVAVGSFDNGPAGYPIALDALVPYLYPAVVRRRVRAALRAVHPWVIRFTGGLYPRTPAAEFARLFDAVLLQVRGLARGAAGVVLGPTSHTSSHYANIHPQREARERLLLGIGAQHGFPGVPAWRLVEPFKDELNPDGIHWPAPAHAAVARALAEQLLAQIRGEAPRPPSPWAIPPATDGGS